MTEAAAAPPPAPSWNEANIEKALMDAQGDLLVAAQLLGHVTVLKLDRTIRKSERLQNAFLAIKQVKALPEYDRMSQEQIELEIVRRLTLYRSDALDAIHTLATMDHGADANMAQVRLQAASKLAGGPVDRRENSGIEQVLRELNDAYQQSAPRIKITRTQSIEIGNAERVVEGETLLPDTPAAP